MKKNLSLGSIKLPIQAATKGFAFIGKRGSGKSYGAAVLAEEFAEAKVPFVVFDPIDVWWGLKVSADGKGKGLPVVVFGKEHADIQLTRSMGKQIAQAIVRENVSCVISTFGMSKSEMRETITDFSEELLNINDTPRHVFIEEAHEYVPQRVMGATARCFAAVEALIVMGRNRGIGVSLLNQRMATINKDVVSQIDTLMAFRSVGPQDRKALKDWVEAHDGTQEEFDAFIKSVPSLPSGEAWLWSPEFLGIFERIKIRKRTTFHPDREKLGTTFKMPTISATDIQSFVDNFKKPKDVVAHALHIKEVKGKVNDHTFTLPPMLKDQIAEAERRGYDAGCKAAESAWRKEADKIRREAFAEVDRLRKIISKIGQLVAGDANGSVTTKKEPVTVSHPGGGGGMDQPGGGGGFPLSYHRYRAADEIGASGGDGASKPIQGGAMRMLKVLVSKYPMEFTRPQLGTLSDVKHSGGTFTTYMSALKVAGLIEEVNGKVRATQAGLDYLGEERPASQSSQETRDMWRGKLQGGARRMFEVLETIYPHGYPRIDLGEAAEVTSSGGTFTTYLSQLKSNGLAVEESGIIKMSDTLFL